MDDVYWNTKRGHVVMSVSVADVWFDWAKSMFMISLSVQTRLQTT